MKNRKILVPIYGVLAVILAVFNLTAFLLAKTKGANFWSGYVFITVSLFYTATVCTLTLRKESSDEYGFFLSVPQVMFSTLYLLFQFIAGVAIMLIPDFNARASVIVQAILLALYTVVIIGLSYYKGSSKQLHDERATSTSFKKSLLMETENAVNRSKNPVLKNKLNEINDLLEYTDPVSSFETAECESRIRELFAHIGDKLSVVEGNSAVAMCDEIIVLLKQRNAICAANKKH